MLSGPLRAADAVAGAARTLVAPLLDELVGFDDVEATAEVGEAASLLPRVARSRQGRT